MTDEGITGEVFAALDEGLVADAVDTHLWKKCRNAL